MTINVFRQAPKRQLLLLLCIFFMQAQLFAQGGAKVTGRVFDAKGDALIGVTVSQADNPQVATVTDINGTYTLQLPTVGVTIRFAYMGFKEKTVRVTKSAVIDVALEENVSALNEVVVVGYGTQKKASVVGAINNLEPSKLNLVSSRSMSNGFAGMVPGIIAVQRSGDPWNNNSDFWIRGISSFAGNTQPLVLIDGIERSINDIDPDEVASFSVLKDAAASAVYGVRGANGVIMVETKRGSIGKPQVSVRFEHALSQPVRIPQYVGSVKYLELVNEMYSQDGMAPYVSEATLRNYRDKTDPELYPDVNWWDVISKNHADNTRATLSVNGGSNVLRYALVAGYYNENGILARDKTKAWDSSLKVDRYTVRSNVDINITSSTILRINIGGYLQSRNAPPGDISDSRAFYNAMRIPPYIHPAIYADGKIPRIINKDNPWAALTQRGYERLNHSNVEALTSIEQDLKFVTPGLRLKLTYAFDKFSANSVTRAKNPDYYHPATGRDYEGNLITSIQANGEDFLGYAKDAKWGNQSVYVEATLNYNRTFGSKHAVNGMLLYNHKNFDDGSFLPFRTQGFAGRTSYTYDDRYVAEFNFGYNGSENFAPGKRFGFFPAVAAGWIVTQEKFMQRLTKVLSLLKIRASWGLAGNSNINGRRFAYLSTIANNGEYYFGSDRLLHRLGRAEGDVGVPDLTWEKLKIYNVGVDASFWKGLLYGSLDVFYRKRTGIPGTRLVTLPSTFGATLPEENLNSTSTRGFELTVASSGQWADLRWDVNANISWARSKWIYYEEPDYTDPDQRRINRKTGQWTDRRFGYVADGLFTSQDEIDNLPYNQDQRNNTTLRPGDVRFRDINGDKVIDWKDEVEIGKGTIPTWFAGFNPTLHYKDFDLSLSFQGAFGFDVVASLGGNTREYFESRWTPENNDRNALIPRVGGTSDNSHISTYWLVSGDYVRWKSFTLGYTLKHEILKKANIQSIHFFFSGSNIYTWSKLKKYGLDPEGPSGRGGLYYPQQRDLSIGATVIF